ncbi:sensor histidine kinase [Pseudaquabacterium rugosum]|uniref:histidine kinase n=1 Tax=Pseudaquabacterium rugosum TaxID=2984194 RepID=A0ABU9BFJ4_9BURK
MPPRHALRMLVLGVGAGLALVCLFVALHLWLRLEQADEEGRQAAQRAALGLENTLLSQVLAVDVALQAASDEFQGARRDGSFRAADWVEWLDSWRGRLRLEALRATDETGLVRWGAGAEQVQGLRVDDRPYFRQLRDQPGSTLVIGRPLRSVISGRTVLPLARALRDAEGRFAGMVYAFIAVEPLASALSASIGHEAELLVYDAEGWPLLQRPTPLRSDDGPQPLQAPGAMPAPPPVMPTTATTTATAATTSSAPPHRGMAGDLASPVDGAGSDTGLAATMRAPADWIDAAALRAWMARGGAGTLQLLHTDAAPARHVATRQVGRYPLWVASAVPRERFRHQVARDALPGLVLLALLGITALCMGQLLWRAWLRREHTHVELVLAHRRLQQVRQEAEAARQSAERASRAKSVFLAVMSHEMRTPLNGVMGFAHVGRRDPACGPRAQQLFQRILDSGQTLLQLINDVLDFSRIEAGKLSLQTQTVDLMPLLQRVRDTVQPQLAPGVQLRLETPPDTPLALSTDPLRLEQVLLNLMSNAAKFTPQGEVVLRAALGAARDDGTAPSGAGAAAAAADPAATDGLWLEVRDTGIGIAHDQIDRLFEPFEQGERERMTRQTGTGLGLAITRRLVQAMGGRIQVSSAPGAGSRFAVWLPLRRPDGGAA